MTVDIIYDFISSMCLYSFALWRTVVKNGKVKSKTMPNITAKKNWKTLTLPGILFSLEGVCLCCS